MKNREKLLVRWGVYLAGLLILALGITLNTKTGLGVSPIVSIAFVAAQLGGWSIGNTTLISYLFFMLIQLALKGKKYRLSDLLQLPLSIVFTRFMNLFSDRIPVQTQLPGQLAMLLFAIVLTGIGAAMSLDARLVPNPADGLVQAFSDFTGKEMGLCKNIFDGVMVALSVIIALAFQGRIIGVGIGTLAAILGNGRMISQFNKLFLKRLQAMCGLE